MKTVLVVDDMRALAEQYSYDLKRVGGFETLIAGGGQEAIELASREAVDCIVLDLEMPGVDGFDVLRHLRDEKIETPVIVYTGTASYDRCAQAVRLGAYSFIDKAEPMERVVQEIRNALESGRLVSAVRSLEIRLDAESSLVGTSAAMLELRQAMARVAPIPSQVLIVGESGSGKELVARDLHRISAPPRAPFVALNCAALQENLIDSELFGHEHGAFTGANRLRKGAFELAGHGTLFLDEIGELPLPSQAKLLRVIEERRLLRVGGSREVSVETRVLAATNRDLEAEIEAGRFRQDLYYRLAVHVLELPPLRERLSDIPQLVEHLLAAICDRFGIRQRTVDARAIEALQAYDWAKNNVRELRNILERMVIATDDSVLGLSSVPPEILHPSPGRSARSSEDGEQTFRSLKAEAERRILLRALRQHNWHITKTAHALGLADHSSLLKIMKRHGLRSSGHTPTP